MRRKQKLVVVFCMLLLSKVCEGLLTSTRPLPLVMGKRKMSSVVVRYPLVNGRGVKVSESRLFLDLFGLGPTEVVIIAAAAGLLYGPDRLKQQLRDRGVKGTIVSSGWKEERAERIKLMSDYATIARKKRAWKRINEAIADEDPIILDKMAAFEDDATPR